MSKSSFRKYFFIFAILVIFSLLIMELVGFSEYANSSMAYQKRVILPEQADMVVVLSGGTGRISPAYKLMRDNNIPLLYVAGTNERVNFDELAKNFNIDDSDRDKIKVDNLSKTTVQNAELVLDFIHQQQPKSLILVTSVYHMKRAEYIFSKLLAGTGVNIYPYVTYTKELSKGSWWSDFRILMNILEEFIKFQYYRIILPLR